MNSNSFGRDEKLKSRKQIDLLFKEGNSLKQFPVILLWANSEREDDQLVQTAFTVSKRNFKRAVDRNRIKRQMREVFRVNKEAVHHLAHAKNAKMDLMWLYVGKELPEFDLLESKIIKVIDRFCKEQRPTE